MSCLFCRIAAGEIPAGKIYESESLLAFHDTSPQAPVHFLVIPKEHIQSADCITPENCTVAGEILSLIPKLAKELGVTQGYRIVTNIGENGGQTVPHMHFHVLGGRHLSWPPG